MTPTRQQVEELIDKLADKTLSFGCRVIMQIKSDYTCQAIVCGVTIRGGIYFQRTACQFVEKGCVEKEDGLSSWQGYINKILGHPILIGDVLKSATGLLIDRPSLAQDIVGRWIDCDVSKSLQEIVEASGWEESPIELTFADGEKHKIREYEGEKLEYLKDSHANALFTFLIDIFN